MKESLLEILGVPSEIEKSAKEIYLGILDQLKKYSPDDIISSEMRFNIKKDEGISVGNITISHLPIEIDVQSHPKAKGITLYSLDFNSPIRLTNKYKNFTSRFQYPEDVYIGIHILYPSHQKLEVRDLIKFIEDNDEKIISSLSHELHHMYFNAKNPLISISKMLKYDSYSNVRTGLESIDKLIYYLYYIDNVENVVRPSEVYTSMVESGITKSQFKKFLSDNRVISILKEIRELSYDGFKQNLLHDIEENDRRAYNIYKNKEELIEVVLNSLYRELANHQIGSLSDIMGIRNPLDLMLNPEKGEEFTKHFKSIEKYGGRGKQFFEKTIKNMGEKAEKVIRKIGKLYDLVPDDKDKINEGKECISDYETWRDFYVKSPKVWKSEDLEWFEYLRKRI